MRDVTFAEDKSRIRKGSAPEIMAAVRNAAIGFLRSTAQRISLKPFVATLPKSECSSPNSASSISQQPWELNQVYLYGDVACTVILKLPPKRFKPPRPNPWPPKEWPGEWRWPGR